MVLPIYLYGHPVLRKETTDIPSDYANLHTLLDNMYETMYQADGVGDANNKRVGFFNIPLQYGGF